MILNFKCIRLDHFLPHLGHDHVVDGVAAAFDLGVEAVEASGLEEHTIAVR